MIRSKNLFNLLQTAKAALRAGDTDLARDMFREINCQFDELESDFIACKAIVREVRRFTFKGST
jgi:hypothetical protein